VIFVVVTDAKLKWICKKLLHGGSAWKAQNSALKAYVPWNYIVTNAWTFRLAIQKGRPLFSGLMRNFILNKTFLSKQLFSVCSYFLISPRVFFL
jgi:putative flippase GtrA